MLRFSTIRRIACFGSVAVALAACTTVKQNPGHLSSNGHAGQQGQYDDHYGLPPTQRLARSGRSEIEVNPLAPQTYTVKKGDTLWDIAQMYLNTPWHWPEIWDKNQQIKNPHLIRPGDVLHFGYVRVDNKLVPRIRVEPRGSGATLTTIAPFLTWPRVLDEAAIRAAPYILASRDHQILMTPGETVYVRNLRNPRIGERYAVYHPKHPLHDPETGKLLGHQVTYGGYARIDKVDNVASATLLEVENIIREGDRLLPKLNEEASLRIPIQIPTHKIRGQIVDLYEAENISANYMILVLNRGKKAGIKPGYTLGVYKDGGIVTDKYQPYRGHARGLPKVKLPPHKVANAIVYNVMDNLSYALIVDSKREVSNGDKIGNP